MNISSEVFPSDGSNFSHSFFSNVTKVDICFARMSVVEIIIFPFVFPINSYVIWLIVSGTGNGLAAEFFSLNIAVSEIFFCIESLLSFFSTRCNNLHLVVLFLDGFSFTGRPLLTCLICVERYLAVVHPVTFLKYKPLRYRVICSVIVWVAIFVSCGINIIAVFFSFIDFYFIVISAQFSLFLCLQLFCLVDVLRALKQSGPGERGREREEENNIKRRAFLIILINVMAMFLFYIPFVVLSVLDWISADYNATLFSFNYVHFTLAGLVQPFLFLYWVRKLPFIKSLFNNYFSSHH